MIIIHIAMTLGSDAEVQKFAAGVPALVATTRKEQGCIEYALARDIADPRTVRVTERWASPQALEAHMNQPHVKEGLAALKSLNVTALTAKMFEGSGERDLPLS